MMEQKSIDRCILCVNKADMASLIANKVHPLFGEFDEVLDASALDLRWYWDYAKKLRDATVDHILLVAVGWWLGDGPPPEIVRIVDHVACHLPNPLTGTAEARDGKAFIDMHQAYFPWNLPINAFENVSIPDAILWHTNEKNFLRADEVALAKSARCDVASPCVVPLVVGARAAGIKISAFAFPVS